MVPVRDYEKRYAEAFTITKVRTFKHKPFFNCWGRGGGGAYLWYFTVVFTFEHSHMYAHTWDMVSAEGNTAQPYCV